MHNDFSLLFHIVWNWYALPSLFALVVNGILLVVILRRYQRQPTMTAVLYMFFTTCLAVWSFGEAMQRIAMTQEGAVFWGAVASTGWIFMPPLFFHFTMAFSNLESFARSWVVSAGLYLPAAVFYFLSLTTSVLLDPSNYGLSPWGWTPMPPTKFFNFVFSPWLEFFLITALIIFARKFFRKSVNREERMQAGIISLGLLVPLVMGSVTQIVLPALGYYIVGLSTLFLPVLAVAVLIAMLRYRLFSITPANALSAILDSIKDAVIVVNNTFAIQFVNRAATLLFNRPGSNIVGSHLAALFPPSTAQWTMFRDGAVSRLAQGEIVEQFETVLINADHREFPVSISASPIQIPEAGSNPVGFALVARDTKEIQDLIQELENRSQQLQAARLKLEQELVQATP